LHYLLFYEKVPNHAERETPLKKAHWDHLQASVHRGELILGGSLGHPNDGGAVLLFQADSEVVVEEFARADPYVIDGLVNRWQVRTWDTVVGTGIANLKSRPKRDAAS
jgi:uncharacterized protein